ncbi:PREDICTED: uncharacterized protein LOC105564505 [Vollenhovia emeryi]|uniref:uncharacterized protein LOC105564505 n=1 Tax=Vollenhovia emeryi TaxID=411798 RepID=UPI0005F388FC|nr:PREDICTED: uncharacterized protein LOC105564505 [Vollenhovia emeryi]
MSMDKIINRVDINFDNGLPRGADKDTHRMLGKRGNFRKSRRAERDVGRQTERSFYSTLIRLVSNSPLLTMYEIYRRWRQISGEIYILIITANCVIGERSCARTG